jgi:hypothetical protein
MNFIELCVVTEVFYLNKALALFNTGKHPFTFHTSFMKFTHLPFVAMGKLPVYVLARHRPKILTFNVSHTYLLCNLYAPFLFHLILSHVPQSRSAPCAPPSYVLVVFPTLAIVISSLGPL